MSVLAVVLFALMLVGMTCLYQSKTPERFSLSVIAHVLLFMTVFASLADSPTAAGGRSTHLFLMPIGVATFFLCRCEGFYLRWLFPGMCFCALVALAISPVSLGAGLELFPANIQALGHGLNTLTAVVLTVGVLAIFREDLSARVDQYVALARALAQHELCAYLQPQVSTEGKVIGAEVLLRWDRPGHGIQSPARFIPLAEETGLIHEMGLMVLEQACWHLKAWSRLPGVDQWTLSVNVSPLQLTSRSFVADVRAILHKTGVPPNRLCLEITESVFASDLTLIAAKMNALRDDGIAWSLDDFGTGFSSLSMLQALPLDELKIDQVFVQGMENDASKRELVRKIIEIAGILGVSTIAEGVETQSQREGLKTLGCGAFQGYLFGRPIAATEFLHVHASTPSTEVAKPG
ncbi:putative bifunctional diguanylate cyclase/phosphodiesterase [Pseudomonas sp. 3A(2025)]